jgi:hypothetical protein
MAIRAGMSELITRLRGYAQADTSEYTLAGEVYWTNEQLQERLDRYRSDVYREPLASEPTYSGAGTLVYHNYYFTQADAERASGGSLVWQVENSAGSAIGTADYSVNYDGRQIRFTSDQAGTAHYLTYRHYNVYKAAADVWREKAANVASRFDIRTDNHDLKRSQLRAAYLANATMYEEMANGATTGASGSRMVRMVRADE